MKRWSQRLVIFAVMVMLIITPFFEKQSYGWTVTVQNNSKDKCSYIVYGNHLYWSAVECSAQVGPSTTAVCQMPHAICPHYVFIKCPEMEINLGTSDNILTNIFASKCWDSTVSIPIEGVKQTQWK